jgi:hypothetical protein
MFDTLSSSSSSDPWVPTPEELDRMFNVMNDSVTVIDNKIENGPSSGQTQTECNEEVGRNVGHLEVMLAQSYIQDAGRPLSVYEVAVSDGKNYISTHGG